MTAELSPANYVVCMVLDYYIMVGSFVVKIPQLRKIWQAKSGQGLAMTAITIELLAHCSKTAYSIRRNFPFTSYGEGVFLIVQNCAVGMLVLYYSNRRALSCVYPLVTMTAYVVLTSQDMLDMKLLVLMQAGNLFVTIISKVIQAVTNMQNQGTGQLSKTTTSLLVSGLLARTYTSIMETGDFILVSRYLVSAFFNAILLFQIFYYRRRGITHTKKTVDDSHYSKKIEDRNGDISSSSRVKANRHTSVFQNGHHNNMKEHTS